jgi:hypothetical protein
MRRLKNPVVIVAAVGLLLGWALPTLAQSTPPPTTVDCPGCTPNNQGLTAACSQCGGMQTSVGSNCDVCCASSTKCELKGAEGTTPLPPIPVPGEPPAPVR